MTLTCSVCLEEFDVVFRVAGDCITSGHTGVVCGKCAKRSEDAQITWEYTESLPTNINE